MRHTARVNPRLPGAGAVSNLVCKSLNDFHKLFLLLWSFAFLILSKKFR
jgi:hypothetical protein